MSGANVELATARLLPDYFGHQSDESVDGDTILEGDAVWLPDGDFDALSASSNSNNSVTLLAIAAAAIAFGAVLAWPTNVESAPDEPPKLEDYIQVEAKDKTWFQTVTGGDKTLEEYKRRKSYERATRIGHAQNRSSKMSRQISEASRGYSVHNGRLQKNTNAISSGSL